MDILPLPSTLTVLTCWYMWSIVEQRHIEGEQVKPDART